MSCLRLFSLPEATLYHDELPSLTAFALSHRSLDYPGSAFICLSGIFISSVICRLLNKVLFSCHVCVLQYFPCCCSVSKSCLALCDPVGCSMPRSPVLHSLPEFAQTYVHWVLWCYLTVSSSGIPFPCAFDLSQLQGPFPKSWLFASGGQSTGSSPLASVLPMNIQGWFLSGLTDL